MFRILSAGALLLLSTLAASAADDGDGIADLRKTFAEGFNSIPGIARYKSSDGKWLGIHWNDDPLNLGVWRNGKRRDLANAPLQVGHVFNLFGTGCNPDAILSYG